MRKVRGNKYILGKNRSHREFERSSRRFGCLLLFISGVLLGLKVGSKCDNIAQGILLTFSWILATLANNSYSLVLIFVVLIPIFTYYKKGKYWSRDYRKGYVVGLVEAVFKALLDILGNEWFLLFIVGFIFGLILEIYLKLPIPFF